MVKIQEKYILRCIELGKNGLGTTAPNPMVGCVITAGERIIGEGFTSPYGGPHAEVNAIHSVSHPELLKEATLYVSLEPCAHHGKTPPCTDLIIGSGIPRVVIGIKDPHSKVAGKGIAKLKAAGVEVVCPVLERECREHHKRFLTFMEKKRPYVILKWAESADGFIAPEKELREGEPEPFWISDRYSRQLVHQWRTEEQAILVGTTTAVEDNPRLTPRHWAGKAPLRVVVDRQLKIPQEYHLYDGTAPTVFLTETNQLPEPREGIHYEKIDFSGNLALQVCERLHELEVQSVIVEGGRKTLCSFIKAGFWDEARIFTGRFPLKNGLKSPEIEGKEVSRTKIGGDLLRILEND
ncbi:diaminohydroxyphosphoribosylaminopyrimidine deaminase [Muriicola jejuensis]|uniref:bifunctional diaminohydroxyphosphoribosylaminopyrimidine deaminase/5-amino-6-(5-phosphoribosylamino)uracil reductase RibD n=1 Tax=Muriicola jejuensis TaxID=504488 RepID=UPI0024034D75|nr:bifunctional diaminohydroxyphosphoribosylaminopyrimidine deaminase/5-amino-6-(5-phosphoribosylamino)uracil reductase RibD [Muriicola jejuensis]SMP23218.1 diaminohydroxyphosphoribosylaminopyrimidine deaminase [Muriicola jejuensis]